MEKKKKENQSSIKVIFVGGSIVNSWVMSKNLRTYKIKTMPFSGAKVHHIDGYSYPSLLDKLIIFYNMLGLLTKTQTIRLRISEE